MLTIMNTIDRFIFLEITHFCDTGAQTWSSEHELALTFAPGTARLACASLLPADVDISDIAAVAKGGARGLAFVVTESQARLAGRLRRGPLSIKGAP